MIRFGNEIHDEHIHRSGAPRASSRTRDGNHDQITDQLGPDVRGCVRKHIAEHRAQSTIYPGLGRRCGPSDIANPGALQACVEPTRLECIRSIQQTTCQRVGNDMSYVHDILLDMDFDRAALAAAVEDIRTLFRRTELPVVGPSGRPGTLPVLEDDFIGFNGRNRGCTCDPEGPGYHDWSSCRFEICWGNFLSGGDWTDPFAMDMKPDRPWGISTLGGRYWFDCKTRRQPYDQAVMLAMIALKHGLGEQITMESRGRWDVEWNVTGGLFARSAGWSSSSPVELYEHVFPERAPVQNILSFEGVGA